MSEQELDRRLRLALEETASPAAVARLEEFWQRQRRAERRRRMMRRGAAVAVAASAAMVAVGMLWDFSFRHVEEAHPPVAEQPPVPRATAPEPAPPDVLVQREATMEPLAAARAPTEYERLMFAAQMRREYVAATSPLATEVDAAIERVAASVQSPRDEDQTDNANSADLARSGRVEESLLASPRFQAIVAERLPRLSGAKAIAAIRLLAQHGSPQSTPALLAAARSATLRSEAVAAIEQLAGIEGLNAGVLRSNDRAVRRALVARLLAINSDAAVRSYLSLASNPAVRADALAAADAMKSPPLEGLFRLLKDDDKEVRLAAAMTLGYVNGPRVTQGLITLVMKDPAAPAEAWLALLACRDESAERFLADASQQPRLLGQMNYARVMWARMIQ